MRTADGVSWQWRTTDAEWRERMTGDPRPICTATAEHRAAPVEGKCRIGRCRRMAEPGQSRCARCAETQRRYNRVAKREQTKPAWMCSSRGCRAERGEGSRRCDECRVRASEQTAKWRQNREAAE